jgi:glycerophosphoryl diester phosphodiesterase
MRSAARKFCPLFLRAVALCVILGMTMDASDRVLVHGHRGARAVRPENTLPAFEYAITAGVDVLELDMAVTKDDVVVVSHDPLLTSALCTGPKLPAVIHQLTLDELKQYDCGAVKNRKYPKQQPVPGTRVPTLDEVFALAPRGTFDFNIETKIFKDHPEYTPAPERFVELVVEQVRKHKLESRVIVQSFDFRTLHALKRLAPEIRRSALYPPNFRAAVRGKDFVSIAREADATIVSPDYRLVTKRKVDAAHEAGLEVVPWTANTPRHWQKLIDAGVDAIISDDPAELIAYLKTHQKEKPLTRLSKLFGSR